VYHQWLRSTWGHAVVLVISVGLVAIGSSAAIWASGRHVALVVILSAGLGVVVAEEVIRHRLSRHQAPGLRAIEDPESSRAFASFYRVRVQLRAALDDDEQLERFLLPTVTELTDDLLLRNHGVDRARRGDHARQLLGDELYALVNSPPLHRALDAEAVDRIISRLEEL
jgi:hypothetical protein